MDELLILDERDKLGKNLSRKREGVVYKVGIWRATALDG
jgi:hypothetical protein